MEKGKIDISFYQSAVQKYLTEKYAGFYLGWRCEDIASGGAGRCVECYTVQRRGYEHVSETVIIEYRVSAQSETVRVKEYAQAIICPVKI